MIGKDSRFNATVVLRIVDNAGNQVESARLHLPYSRESVINVSPSDLQDYPVQEGDTWHSIAARTLKGRSDLWWIIAEFSNVLDPFKEFAVGLVLKIPSFESAMFDVLNFQT
jgi:nucleoid-associated protein YgaU